MAECSSAHEASYSEDAARLPNDARVKFPRLITSDAGVKKDDRWGESNLEATEGAFRML
jgi:hypothetical protein